MISKKLKFKKKELSRGHKKKVLIMLELRRAKLRSHKYYWHDYFKIKKKILD